MCRRFLDFGFFLSGLVSIQLISLLERKRHSNPPHFLWWKSLERKKKIMANKRTWTEFEGNVEDSFTFCWWWFIHHFSVLFLMYKNVLVVIIKWWQPKASKRRKKLLQFSFSFFYNLKILFEKKQTKEIFSTLLWFASSKIFFFCSQKFELNFYFSTLKIFRFLQVAKFSKRRRRRETKKIRFFCTASDSGFLFLILLRPSLRIFFQVNLSNQKRESIMR